MKFYVTIQKTFKNGFYIDYFFKNLIFFFYRKIIFNNFFYFIDKYLAENFFYSINAIFKYLKTFSNILKNISYLEIIKFLLLLNLQIILLVIL